MLNPICGECGSPLREGASFCKVCGAPVHSACNTIICTECGKAVPSGSSVCPECGAPTAPQAALMPAQPVADMPESGGLAVCAMVFSLLFPPIGLILGIIGRKKYRIPTNIALCKAAVIISVITCILYTVLLIKVVPELLDTYRTANEAKDKYNKVKEWIPFL